MKTNPDQEALFGTPSGTPEQVVPGVVEQARHDAKQATAMVSRNDRYAATRGDQTASPIVNEDLGFDKLHSSEVAQRQDDARTKRRPNVPIPNVRSTGYGGVASGKPTNDMPLTAAQQLSGQTGEEIRDRALMIRIALGELEDLRAAETPEAYVPADGGPLIGARARARVGAVSVAAELAGVPEVPEAPLPFPSAEKQASYIG